MTRWLEPVLLGGGRHPAREAGPRGALDLLEGERPPARARQTPLNDNIESEKHP